METISFTPRLEILDLTQFLVVTSEMEMANHMLISVVASFTVILLNTGIGPSFVVAPNPPPKAATPCSIKAQITADNSWQFIGCGGRYGCLKRVCSKKDVIESDHFPPKSIYSSAKDKKIKDLKDDDMAAVSVRYTDHRRLVTTGKFGADSAQQKMLTEMKKLFEEGKYFDAIGMNIGWYNENPSPKTGDAQDRFDHLIKEGIVLALDVHVKNGLITSQQKADLITNYKLDVKDPAFNNILNSQPRDEAKGIILTDTQGYAGPTRRR